MGFSYFNYKKNNLNWSEISREERFFSAEFYNEIKVSGINKFLKFLQSKNINMFSESDFIIDWEISYEVCFYRDLIKLFNRNDNLNEQFSLKRTFDLVLFSKNKIIIMEIKAQQGYDGDQLNNIRTDKKQIKDLLKIIGFNDDITIYLLSLNSSNYDMKQSTMDCFDQIILWSEVSQYYDNNKIFKRADEIYRN